MATTGRGTQIPRSRRGKYMYYALHLEVLGLNQILLLRTFLKSKARIIILQDGNTCIYFLYIKSSSHVLVT